METLDENEKNTLLKLAKESIAYGLTHHQIMPFSSTSSSINLQATRASFVTLHLDHKLRGCIGCLEAYQPLSQDVIMNAYRAAFRDPRFPPVNSQEIERMQIEISILSPLQIMHFQSEEDLLKQLRPLVDGLLIEYHQHRGIFLPMVWKELNEKHLFLSHLKLKAGLAPDFWSPEIKAWNFTTEVLCL